MLDFEAPAALDKLAEEAMASLKNPDDVAEEIDAADEEEEDTTPDKIARHYVDVDSTPSLPLDIKKQDELFVAEIVTCKARRCSEKMTAEPLKRCIPKTPPSKKRREASF